MAGTLAPGSLGGFLGPQLIVAATSGGSGVADWTGTRFFAIDYDAGSDAAAGFSDVSLAAAGLVAKKTWAGFLAIFPTVGRGQIAVVGIKPRAAGATYLDPDAVTPTAQVLRGVVGYNRLVIRATADFSNSTSDKIQCGPQTPAGLNA